MSVLQKLKDATVPSAMTGLLSVPLYYFFISKDVMENIPIGGMEIPVWGAIGGSVFVGSEIGALLSEYVAPKIPVIKDLQSESNMLVPAISSGVGAIAAFNLLISSNTNNMQAFALGAGSNVVSQLVYSKL